jgi:hypothetical protein
MLTPVWSIRRQLFLAPGQMAQVFTSIVVFSLIHAGKHVPRQINVSACYQTDIRASRVAIKRYVGARKLRMTSIGSQVKELHRILDSYAPEVNLLTPKTTSMPQGRSPR